MKNEKEIEQIAQAIIDIENKLSENAEEEMLKIIEGLSLEDLLAIDEYIIEKGYLKK